MPAPEPQIDSWMTREEFVAVTDVGNRTLYYLRRIDEKVEGLTGDMREMKERLGNLEFGFSGMERRYAEASLRIDRMDLRLERIERRLEISGPP